MSQTRESFRWGCDANDESPRRRHHSKGLWCNGVYVCNSNIPPWFELKRNLIRSGFSSRMKGHRTVFELALMAVWSMPKLEELLNSKMNIGKTTSHAVYRHYSFKSSMDLWGTYICVKWSFTRHLFRVTRNGRFYVCVHPIITSICRLV